MEIPRVVLPFLPRRPVAAEPAPPALVLVSTVTGALTVLVTKHAPETLEHLGASLELARREVFATAHAEKIAAALRWQFRAQAISTWGPRLWFTVAMDDALAALRDFDLATGERQILGDVRVGDRVALAITTADQPGERRRGEVRAISGDGFLVHLEAPVGDLVGVWAPRSAIKRVVRVPAIAGGAA